VYLVTLPRGEAVLSVRNKSFHIFLYELKFGIRKPCISIRYLNIKETGRKRIPRYTAVGKSVPLQAWSGPEVSRKLRLSDFMTMAQDGGKVLSLTHRPPLPAGNAPDTHFC